MTAIGTAAALACAVGAPSAGASQTFGSDLTLSAGSAVSCVGTCTDPHTTFLLAAVHTGNTFPASSPIDGVVVSFGVKASAAETITFRLGTFDFTTAGTTSATGPTVSLAGAGTQNVPARVPVQAGEFVAYDFATTGGDASAASSCGAPAGGFGYNPPLVDGAAPQAQTYNTSCEHLVNATVEADADHDGFGDETQDLCVGTAGPENGCPASSGGGGSGGGGGVTPGPPETTITSGPGNRLAKGKARFEFASSQANSTFMCKIDRKAFRGCTSPTKYKLPPGKHKFQVEAANASGMVDATPATKKFTVPK